MDRWLFDGKLVFEQVSRGRSDDPFGVGDGIHFKIKYQLNINPSRFINHTYARHGIKGLSLQRLKRTSPENLLLKYDIASDSLSLDGNDNFVPTQAFKKIIDFDKITKIYIEKIIEFLGTSVENCFSLLNDGTLLDSCLGSWQINHFECYWEYSTQDAISFVNDLWPHVRSTLYSASKKMYRVPRHRRTRRLGGWVTSEPTEGIARNAPSLTGNLGPEHLNFAIYAKEYERVRFEVRYTETIRRFLGPKGNIAKVPADIKGLWKIMRLTRENAHKRFSKLKKSIPHDSYTEPSDFKALADLLTAIALAYDKERPEISLHDMISALINNGGLTIHTTTREHKIMQALQKAHIVKRADALIVSPSGEQKYQLNGRYANIMTDFRRVFRTRTVRER